MRFMMLVKASEDSEAGVMPTQTELTEMGEYNKKLSEAGILLAGEGLHPSSKGTRLTFRDGEVHVTDGPFTETKELVAGYWLIRVDSEEEALQWARRIPFREGEVELRRVFEAEDFGDELTPALREQEERLRREGAERE